MSYNLRFKVMIGSVTLLSTWPQVRGLASMPQTEDADEAQIRFLVGTTNLREDNEVTALRICYLSGFAILPLYSRYTL